MTATQSIEVARTTDSLRVLIIDDDQDQADGLADLLSLQKFQVAVAYRIDQALQCLQHFDAQVALIDVRLGSENGIELVRELSETHPHIMCVMVTAYADLENTIQSIQEGVFDFLRKPLSPALLLITLNRCAEQIRLKQEREAAKEALLESEQRYRSMTDDVLDSSQVGLFILDAQFKVVWLNQAIESYFGLRRQDVIQKDLRQVIHDRVYGIFEDSDEFRDLVFATYDNNTYVESFQCHVLPGEQREERWLEHHSQPILSGLYAGGRIEHYYDVTKRKQAEEASQKWQEELLAHKEREKELVEAELAKVRSELIRSTRLATIGQMTASIAHEIRNPLGAVRNATFLLKRYNQSDNPKVGEYLEIIDQEIDAADGVICDILEMTSAKRPAKQSFDLSALVREVFERTTAKKTMTRQLICNPNPFLIVADEGQLRQVIRNLIANAMQAMRGRGELTVELREDGDHSLILVRDNGPGVDVQYRDQLFEPLFTTEAKGTGMGLTICRQIVEAHNGSIVLQEHEGPGALFCVRIPLESADERSAE